MINLTPKARRTRSALLDAAKSELGNRGVAGVTVMGVCERAGVGRTSFYNYFGDAEELVSIVAQESARDIKERFDHLHADIPRGRNRLEACLRMILKVAKSEPEIIRLIVTLSSSTPEITNLLHEEILAEVSAFVAVTDEEKQVLVGYLAQTVLALARELAMGELLEKDIDRYVGYMMKACD